MACMRVAFHENDRNDENDSDSYKQGVEYWITGIMENTEMMKTTGGANPWKCKSCFSNRALVKTIVEALKCL